MARVCRLHRERCQSHSKTIFLYGIIWWFPKMRVPKNGWFKKWKILLLKWMITIGVPPFFMETPIYIHKLLASKTVVFQRNFTWSVRTLSGFSRVLMRSFRRKRPWTATPSQALPRRAAGITGRQIRHFSGNSAGTRPSVGAPATSSPNTH